MCTYLLNLPNWILMGYKISEKSVLETIGSIQNNHLNFSVDAVNSQWVFCSPKTGIKYWYYSFRIQHVGNIDIMLYLPLFKKYLFLYQFDKKKKFN